MQGDPETGDPQLFLFLIYTYQINLFKIITTIMYSVVMTNGKRNDENETRNGEKELRIFCIKELILPL